MKFLLGSEKPDAKKMIKRLESNDLEDCIEQTWKWLALNSPVPSDPNDQRRNEKICDKISELLGYNRSQKDKLHVLRKLRNDIAHPEDKTCKKKPNWEYVKFGLETVENLNKNPVNEDKKPVNEDQHNKDFAWILENDHELYHLKIKIQTLNKDFELGKFTWLHEKIFFDQARIFSRSIIVRESYLKETYDKGIEDAQQAINDYLGREQTIGEIIPKCPQCSRLLHPEESVEECDWCGYELTQDEIDSFS